MVDRFKIREAYYKDEAMKLGEKDITVLFAEIFEEIDEIKERLKKLEGKHDEKEY